MPITPFHFGPGAALQAMAPRHVSFLAFCAANVLIDVESLYNLVHGRHPVHAFFHTYVGATLAALAIVAAFWLLRRAGVKRPLPNLTLRQVAIGAALGAWSHVLLDSVMHHDIQPLMPFSAGNALQGWISLPTLHAACVSLGFAALVLIGLRRWAAARRQAPSEAVVPTGPMADLLGMLEAHGLDCTVADGWLLPQDRLPGWRASWHPGEKAGRLDVHVLVREGVLIEECFAGVGTGVDGLRDGMRSFALSSLHVLLAAFWDRSDAEQVATEQWDIRGKPYTAYIGNFGTRVTEDGEFRVPQQLFPAITLAVRTAELREDLHWLRFFVGNVRGTLTFEALLDNDEWPVGLDCLRGLSWPQTEGYYSVRLFILLRSASPTPEMG
ncbi:DUF6348 family protein [Roseateles sp. P5_E7]